MNLQTEANQGSPPPRVIVVEDDAQIRTLLTRILRENEFRAVGVRDGREMFDALNTDLADLVMLDVMLPGVSGLDLCRQLRGAGTRFGHVPIVMLTARGDELDRVLGLELGADDYICKPFSQRELLARVRAVLRRVQGLGNANGAAPEPAAVWRFSGWSLDLRRRELLDPEGSLIDLSGAEYELLLSFIENAQRVIGRERLMELSRTRVGDASDRSIDVLVSRLRRKLGGESARGLIRTVRGTGYIFAADVARG
jgi:DNA-binding response OmpR family regulator